MLDIPDIRARFPALQRVEAGYPAAYFDGPGGTQVVQSVVDAMSDYLVHHNANTHWAYATSAETDALILRSRQALADFLACSPAEVAFGANMTTLTFHFTRALGEVHQHLHRAGLDLDPLIGTDELITMGLDQPLIDPKGAFHAQTLFPRTETLELAKILNQHKVVSFGILPPVEEPEAIW